MLQADDRFQDAAAGGPPRVIEWMFACSFLERPVLGSAGTFLGATEAQPVQEDCRSAVLWRWAPEVTGRGHLADC